MRAFHLEGGRYSCSSSESPGKCQQENFFKKEKRPKPQRRRKSKNNSLEGKTGVETDFINLGKLTPEVLAGKAQTQMHFR